MSSEIVYSTTTEQAEHDRRIAAEVKKIVNQRQEATRLIVGAPIRRTQNWVISVSFDHADDEQAYTEHKHVKVSEPEGSFTSLMVEVDKFARPSRKETVLSDLTEVLMIDGNETWFPFRNRAGRMAEVTIVPLSRFDADDHLMDAIRDNPGRSVMLTQDNEVLVGIC